MAAPKREWFKAAEVCEVAEVQPYMLRSWEAEFPQLGRAPAAGGPRLYGRADIDMVLRIKSLVFGEGLTLAGARRRLVEMAGEMDEPVAMEADDGLGDQARERVRSVRDGLRDLLQMLSTGKQPNLVLTAPEKRAAKSRRRAS